MKSLNKTLQQLWEGSAAVDVDGSVNTTDFLQSALMLAEFMDQDEEENIYDLDMLHDELSIH